jgi:hypothetical protein
LLGSRHSLLLDFAGAGLDSTFAGVGAFFSPLVSELELGADSVLGAAVSFGADSEDADSLAVFFAAAAAFSAFLPSFP